MHIWISLLWLIPGLNDRDKEGKWQWSDKSPVTYTDWSRSSGYANIEQPDGAEVEDCSMIRLDSMHSTRSWHDIPCAYDQVQQFLCETSIRTNRELGKCAISHPSTAMFSPYHSRTVLMNRVDIFYYILNGLV